MLQRIRKMMKNDNGFTLVELMVVVAILAILAAIAIPRFTGQREKALEAQGKADIKILQDAYDLYLFQENGAPSGTAAQVAASLKNAGYLKDIPVEPDGYDYQFENGIFTLYKHP
ncbi:MAG: prepilin-type N-terminal cleavage/methylation domain-containing protein [Bacillota bacterium]